MTLRPGTVHTASSAKRPRRAKPCFRANASKMWRTSSSFAALSSERSELSAAATTVLPARDQAFDVPSLRLGELHLVEEPSGFGRVVVRDRCLQVLAKRRRLAEL